MLDHKAVLEKVYLFWFFCPAEMAKTELAVTIIPPSEYFFEGRLGNAVFHTTGKLHNLFSQLNSRKLYLFKSQQHSVYNHIRFIESLPLFTGGVLTVKMSISNYKRLLILDFHHCELIMCVGFLQSTLRNSKRFDGLESITAWAYEIVEAIVSPSVDLV